MAEAEAEAEDEEELAQWMPECDDCDNLAEHYCTTCGDKLCLGCKDHHLSRKKNRDHQVVPYSAGMRAAQKSKSTCSKHPGERYRMYCTRCSIPVCTPCVTLSHSGHEFIRIPDAFSLARETAISELEELTKVIRPRITDGRNKTKQSKAEALSAIDLVEKEIRSRTKLLHQMVDAAFEEKMKQLGKMKEKTIVPLLQTQNVELENLHQNVEKIIKEYEDCLRSKDPIDLISFMNGRGSKDLQSEFPELVVNEVLQPKFEAVSVTGENILSLFGSISLRESQSETPDVLRHKSAKNNDRMSVKEKGNDSAVKLDSGKDKADTKDVFLGVMKQPERVSEFTCTGKSFNYLYSLRYLPSDKMWISGHGRTVVLVDKEGTVLRKVNVQCQMYGSSGVYCTDNGELIYCDRNGRTVRKISHDFRIITLFNTGDSKPYGIHQLQSGDWVVCMMDEGKLRVYDGAGKVVREIGQGHLQRPFYVSVNRVNDDICVSDCFSNVIVFSSSGEKRFTYTGQGNTGTGFNPDDLCCDRLGNILIIDYAYHRVHIIDRDGHFLQYLVSGRENISLPITIDIDDRGYAWVGEWNTRKVKVYKYLSKPGAYTM